MIWNKDNVLAKYVKQQTKFHEVEPKFMTAVLRFKTAMEYVQAQFHSRTFENSATNTDNSCSENLTSMPKAQNKTITSIIFYISIGSDNLPEPIPL